MGRLFLVDMDDPTKYLWERCTCPRCHTTIAFLLTDVAKLKVTPNRPEDGGDLFRFRSVKIIPTGQGNKNRVQGTFAKAANIWTDDDHKHRFPTEGWTSVDVRCTKCCHLLGKKYVDVESHCEAREIRPGRYWLTLECYDDGNWGYVPE